MPYRDDGILCKIYHANVLRFDFGAPYVQLCWDPIRRSVRQADKKQTTIAGQKGTNSNNTATHSNNT